MGLVVSRQQKRSIHRYNNVYSKQCANMGVPYQYDGFLFDSVQNTVHDQIRNIDLYPAPRPACLHTKLGNFLKIGDSIIQHYQQGYLRCEISKITSHKNIYVQRWTEEWDYMLGQDLIDKGYVTDPYNHKQWMKITESNHYTPNRFWENIAKIQKLEKGESDGVGDTEVAVQALKDSYFDNPLAGKVCEPRTADREWRVHNYDLYAIPKERLLYLKIQE